MEDHQIKLYIVVIACVLISVNCGTQSLEIIDNRITDGEYDNHPPLNNSTPKIEQILNSIAMINCTAYYTQYEFEPSDEVFKEDIDEGEVLTRGESFNINKNSAGTGLILSVDGNQVLLLTCNHIIDYPDEVFNYFTRFFTNNYVNIYLKKQKQTQFVTLDNNIVDLELIAKNKRKDIALLGGTSNGKVMNISEPKFKFGKTNDIRTGNFIYIFGFPKGHKMVSTGTISTEGSNRLHYMIDTPFNRGMSGGIVFAIRDDSPNFEMVGMAKSAAADFEYILKPDKNITDDRAFNESLPYEGNIFVEEKPRIRYGITYVNNIDIILAFLKQNRTKIEKAGYNIDHLFESEK
jgi:S1-C subfamily serine protease